MTSHEEKVEADTTSQQLTIPCADENIVHNPPFFAMLNRAWDECVQFRRDEKDQVPVKVAILDTGIDLKHPDFEKPRAIKFRQGEPISAAGEPKQKDRIKKYRDYTISESEAKMMEDRDGHGTKEKVMENCEKMEDYHGHGTKVASIILRLAPGADLYIARICRGNDQGNLDDGGGEEAEQDSNEIHPNPGDVVKAIDWAIGHGVDIINMSFGFTAEDFQVQHALKRAQREGILIFAAAGNGGIYKTPAWPARDSTIAIGIHSCDGDGQKSRFTPWPIAHNPNFMVIGEGIMAHWPTTRPYKGPINSIDGFGPVKGTSFATPVAVSMAAIILAFTRRLPTRKIAGSESRHNCGRDLQNRGAEYLKKLKENEGMARVLQAISLKPETTGGYSRIHPELLWVRFFQDGEVLGLESHSQKKRACCSGWEILRGALDWPPGWSTLKPSK